MPVKPVYYRAPLNGLSLFPLGPGQVKTDDPTIKNIYTILKKSSGTCRTWEAAFLLECILYDDPSAAGTVDLIRQAFAKQQENGELNCPVADALSITRAALRVYEHMNDRGILKQVSAWCGWCYAHWDEIIQCREIRVNPGELMELAVKMYLYTGSSGYLQICEKLYADAMQWNRILKAFSQRLPFSQTIKWEELETHLQQENGTEGYYGVLHMSAQAEKIADGLRGVLYNSIFKGALDDSSAPETAWKRLKKWHGIPCGGTTADDVLEGAAPSFSTTAASLAAWAEAFSACSTRAHSGWAIDELECLIYNGLKACMQSENVVTAFRVNQLDSAGGMRACYHIENDDQDYAVHRLAKAWAAVYMHAVMTTPDGFSVQLYLPGSYTLAVHEQACRIHIDCSTGASLQIQTKKPFHGTIRLRKAEWMKNYRVMINGKETAFETEEEQFAVLNREWNPGDRIDLQWERAVYTVEGHHHGIAVFCGADLMSFPVKQQEEWKYGASGEPVISDNQVVLPVKVISDWKAENGIPEDIPVFPVSGHHEEQIQLVRFSEAGERITVFPQCRNK